MGQAIEKIAIERKHKVTEIIDPKSKYANTNAISKNCVADIFIDFSTPDSVIQNIYSAISANKNIIVGTTGWYEKINLIKEKNQKKIAIVWGSNFSIAVNSFFHSIKNTTQLTSKFKDCDISIFESHHKEKIDSPSGTAIKAGKIIIDNSSKEKLVFGNKNNNEKIEGNELQISSMRIGKEMGTHSVFFDFPSEQIEIKCSSKDRNGYAFGAILAAEWSINKNGMFEFSDVFQEITKINNL